MGLLDKLQQQGSAYSEYDGTQPPTNPLATPQSQLHANGAGMAGYSLNGAFGAQVNSEYNAYLDGVGNQIPFPSLLDTNGVVPSTSPGGQGLPYLNNLPQ